VPPPPPAELRERDEEEEEELTLLPEERKPPYRSLLLWCWPLAWGTGGVTGAEDCCCCCCPDEELPALEDEEEETEEEEDDVKLVAPMPTGGTGGRPAEDDPPAIPALDTPAEASTAPLTGGDDDRVGISSMPTSPVETGCLLLLPFAPVDKAAAPTAASAAASSS
jgi:hypothetical protein